MSFADIPWDKILEVFGFSIGLLYLWWEYHADSRLWLASVVMPFISMWIYFNKGIYADFAINIYYFVIAIYGYWLWTRHAGDTGPTEQKKKKERPISHIKPIALLSCTAVFAILWFALFLGLKYLTDSTVPVADSFTTALSIVATWMLARKYLEQWLAWVAVDAVSVGLYIYKGIYLYAVLYFIYTIIAVVGYLNWIRLMKKQQ